MASSSGFAVVSVAIVLQFLVLFSASASTSPEYIESICKNVDNVTDKAFCLKTLKSYPPMAKARNQFKAVDAVLHLCMSYAEKSAGFAKNAATNNPNLKKQFGACQDAYQKIMLCLKSAAGELKESPDTANYDVMVSYDQTTMVKDLVGKNTDKASQTVIKMALMMDKLIGIAVGATVSVGG